MNSSRLLSRVAILRLCVGKACDWSEFGALTSKAVVRQRSTPVVRSMICSFTRHSPEAVNNPHKDKITVISIKDIGYWAMDFQIDFTCGGRIRRVLSSYPHIMIRTSAIERWTLRLILHAGGEFEVFSHPTWRTSAIERDNLMNENWRIIVRCKTLAALGALSCRRGES